MEENQEKPPRFTDYIAICIWILIFIVIVIAVLSRDQNRREPVALIVQTVSALATAAAALAAFMTVKLTAETFKQARADREKEIELRKPNIAFVQGSTATTRDGKYIFNAQFKNTGIHSARDIVSKGTFLSKKLDEGPELTFNDTIANEIPSQFPFDVYFSDLELKREEDGYYVTFLISYKDAITNKDYKKWFFLDCPRPAFMGLGDLRHATQKEKEQIARHLIDWKATEDQPTIDAT